jgi:hypothetical protein
MKESKKMTKKTDKSKLDRLFKLINCFRKKKIPKINNKEKILFF